MSIDTHFLLALALMPFPLAASMVFSRGALVFATRRRDIARKSIAVALWLLLVVTLLLASGSFTNFELALIGIGVFVPACLISTWIEGRAADRRVLFGFLILATLLNGIFVALLVGGR